MRQCLEETVEVCIDPDRTSAATDCRRAKAAGFGGTVVLVSLAPLERVQQLTAEQTEDVPQFVAATVKMAKMASHEGVQLRAVEQSVDTLQGLKETVEVVTLVPRERMQQRTAEQTEEVPQFRDETARGGDAGPT